MAKKIKTKKIKKVKIKPKTRKPRVVKALSAYEAMDRADEIQMMNDIEGRIPTSPEALVYSFFDKQSGREVTGLAWRGTKEVWRELNKRKVTALTITDRIIVKQGPDYIDIGVYAKDLKRKVGAWGMARGYPKMKLKSGELVEDRFASAKAMSKAQRNALNQLFPAEKIAKMIQRWLKNGKSETLTPQLAAPKENKAGILFASDEDKAKIMRIALELGGKGERIDQFIQKKTGLLVDWKSMTKVQASKILFELMNLRAKK